MIKQLIILSVILFVGVACTKQEDIRGTFVTADAKEIVIDCNYHILSTHLSGKDFMPENGSEISLSRTTVNLDEILLSFMWDSLSSAFAKWDPYSDKIIVGSDEYDRKSFATCK